MKKLFSILLICCAMAATASATKRVVVISRTTNGSQVCYNVANWYVITSGQQTQTNGSAWAGASAAENQSIQTGNILEEVNTECFPVAQDVTSIKAVLVQFWTNRMGQINGVGPGQYNGVFFDSANGWSQ